MKKIFLSLLSVISIHLTLAQCNESDATMQETQEFLKVALTQTESLLGACRYVADFDSCNLLIWEMGLDIKTSTYSDTSGLIVVPLKNVETGYRVFGRKDNKLTFQFSSSEIMYYDKTETITGETDVVVAGLATTRSSLVANMNKKGAVAMNIWVGDNLPERITKAIAHHKCLCGGGKESKF